MTTPSATKPTQPAGCDPISLPAGQYRFTEKEIQWSKDGKDPWKVIALKDARGCWQLLKEPKPVPSGTRPATMRLSQTTCLPEACETTSEGYVYFLSEQGTWMEGVGEAGTFLPTDGPDWLSEHVTSAAW